MRRLPRVVLVHGSVVNAEATWGALAPLAARFTIVAPNRRGYPPGPPVDRVDFEDEAVWLEQFLDPGTHLVGHSYGGVISLFAAARCAECVRSLTVIEPPCFGIARGNPVVDDFVASLVSVWELRDDPLAFLHAFAGPTGGTVPPEGFSPELMQGARTLAVERVPWEADVPLVRLREASFPKLVVSGGHADAFEIVCDTLQRELQAERATLVGAQHSVASLGQPFNALLAEFVERAERAAERN
jgi:pimeloyl-ACP methyl ester carboxylesterase